MELYWNETEGVCHLGFMRPDTTEGKGGLPPERVPQRGIMRKKTGKSHINHYPDSRSNIKCRAWNMKKEISTA